MNQYNSWYRTKIIRNEISNYYITTTTIINLLLDIIIDNTKWLSWLIDYVILIL